MLGSSGRLVRRRPLSRSTRGSGPTAASGPLAVTPRRLRRLLPGPGAGLGAAGPDAGPGGPRHGRIRLRGHRGDPRRRSARRSTPRRPGGTCWRCGAGSRTRPRRTTSSAGRGGSPTSSSSSSTSRSARPTGEPLIAAAERLGRDRAAPPDRLPPREAAARPPRELRLLPDRREPAADRPQPDRPPNGPTTSTTSPASPDGWATPRGTNAAVVAAFLDDARGHFERTRRWFTALVGARLAGCCKIRCCFSGKDFAKVLAHFTEDEHAWPCR